MVTNFYEWGPWVNGGAWLTIGGQRVDFIYRSVEHLDRVIDEAEAGRHELDYAQQPPFGFFSGTYLGEVAVCVPLLDRDECVERLKRRVAKYPEALRRAVVQDYLWAAEFGLAAFARKFAARGDAYGTAACLTRVVNQLVLMLFALNRKYLINDKTALAEAAEFERTPQRFESRVQTIFAGLGDSPARLADAVEAVQELLRESVALAGEQYCEPSLARDVAGVADCPSLLLHNKENPRAKTRIDPAATQKRERDRLESPFFRATIESCQTAEPNRSSTGGTR